MRIHFFVPSSIPLVGALVTLASVCSVLASCSRAQTNEPQEHANAAAVALSASSVVASASATNQKATAPLPPDPRDFNALFQTEAAARPTGTIRTEDAIAAFRKDGVQIDEVKQHLARPYGARYCVGATSGNLVALSVCEYVDAAAAKSGVAVSEKIPLPNREIRINQATSLTVRDLAKTPAADALAKRLFDSFAKLKTP